MLTETFIASTHGRGKISANTSIPKDAGIFLHDVQPTPALKGHFNKSSTERNCLAITNAHVFAAQSDSAIVQVYNRERGNQETFHPFPEHISSLAVIGPHDGASILALGTGHGKAGRDGVDGGRVMLWELATGRSVQSESSHIQPVTCLAVDPTNNYLLSGSADSQIHVWSIPALLSLTELDEKSRDFQSKPRLTLSNHDAGITAIVTGHSHTTIDIAISASEDKRCTVWDYRQGTMLHTFLMGETPLCLAVDPADRCFYAGLSSGAVQMVNFHKTYNGLHPLYDQNNASVPTEPDSADRWSIAGGESSPVLSLDVSYDGTMVLAGHESGAIYAWDVGAPRNPATIVNLARAVTNLKVLPPTGFPSETSVDSRLNRSGTRLLNVVKPRGDGHITDGKSGLYAPEEYTFTACFDEALPLGRYTDKDGKDTLFAEFEEFTSSGNPDLPDSLWEQALADLSTSAVESTEATARGHPVPSQSNGTGASQYEIEKLKAQLSIAQKQQKAMAAKLVELQASNEPQEASSGSGKKRKT